MQGGVEARGARRSPITQRYQVNAAPSASREARKKQKFPRRRCGVRDAEPAQFITSVR
jgi:hypothetical protein